MASELPNKFLENIRAVQIENLYATSFSTQKERAEYTKLAKQKIRAIKKQLSEETDSIKARWDGRKADEAEQERLHLAQYKPLEVLIDQINIFLAEFEIKGEAAPAPPYVGTDYIGDFEDAEWYVCSDLDAWKYIARKAAKVGKEAQDNIADTKERIATYKQIGTQKLRFSDFVSAWVVLCLAAALVIVVFGVSIFMSGSLTFENSVIIFGGLGFILLLLFWSVFGTMGKHEQRIKEAKLIVEVNQNALAGMLNNLERVKSEYKKAQSNVTRLSSPSS